MRSTICRTTLDGKNGKKRWKLNLVRRKETIGKYVHHNLELLHMT